MSAEQPAQGSTAEYCSAWPGDPHAMSVHMRGGALASVRRCDQCGWIDWADLDEQIRERVVEGRRQATEGWERQWGVDTPSGPIMCDDEQDARGYAALPGWGHVVTRPFGPWEPAEQPGAHEIRRCPSCDQPTAGIWPDPVSGRGYEYEPCGCAAELPDVCCDLHGRNCEQGGAECCWRCTEAHHFEIGHGGVPCSSPDLSRDKRGRCA